MAKKNKVHVSTRLVTGPFFEFIFILNYHQFMNVSFFFFTQVNFLPEIITLSKEVRNLKNLGFRVPLAIVNKAHQANQLYPFAISLIESIRTYERTLEKVSICYGISV